MADDDDDSGLSAAVDHLLEMGPTQAAGGSPAQLSLLPSAVVEPVARSGPGRPAGAVNKRTLDMAAYIRARYPSPLVFLAEAYSRPVARLAEELGIDKHKAFQLQLAAAEKLAPYVEQKQPMAVQVNAAGEVTLVISTAPIGTAVAAAEEGVFFEVEDEGNQQVSEG
jgi:hypothetical protein